MQLKWLSLSRRLLLYSETLNNRTCCHHNILLLVYKGGQTPAPSNQLPTNT